MTDIFVITPFTHVPSGIVYFECAVTMSQNILAGMFSLPTLLLKLVSGMGLLTLTATVIDTLALYVLPDRRKYRKSVYDESPVLKPSTKQY